jgi:hypothetical protein
MEENNEEGVMKKGEWTLDEVQRLVGIKRDGKSTWALISKKMRRPVEECQRVWEGATSQKTKGEGSVSSSPASSQATQPEEEKEWKEGEWTAAEIDKLTTMKRISRQGWANISKALNRSIKDCQREWFERTAATSPALMSRPAPVRSPAVLSSPAPTPERRAPDSQSRSDTAEVRPFEMVARYLNRPQELLEIAHKRIDEWEAVIRILPLDESVKKRVKL